MPGPKVKICGVSTADALDAAIVAGASHAGLNFYPPSPRCVTPREAAALAAWAGKRLTRVGVFVDADDDFIAERLGAAQLDAIQLHGLESPERAAQLRTRFGLPVWKVIAVSTSADIAKADTYRDAADFILFDAKTPDGALPGGMGLAFDWSLLASYRGPLPWGLAGGLSPANVATAIVETGASLVDTASGVESSAGIKDVDLIGAFCDAARNALRSRSHSA